MKTSDSLHVILGEGPSRKMYCWPSCFSAPSKLAFSVAEKSLTATAVDCPKAACF